MTNFLVRYGESLAGPAGIGWQIDNLSLTSVGIDIGSSTSHLMFGRVHLRRLAQSLSSRYVVVGRESLWRSNVMLTPYRGDEFIDADALASFVRGCYEAAGIAPDQVDTGVVILTGVALQRRNAESIAALFAERSGRFVCALAGHHREAVMAARGSGSVALSMQVDGPLLNIDIGGGTTKLALVERGEIRSTAAIGVGSRLIVLDDDRRILAAAGEYQTIADHAGVDVRRGRRLTPDDERALADTMVEAVLEHVSGTRRSPLAEALLLTSPLPLPRPPAAVTYSGGVAEYVYGRTQDGYGDLGPSLGAAIRRAIDKGRLVCPVLEPAEGIRATVVGLSQFSVQVTGATVAVGDEGFLPLRNVPVVQPPLCMGGPGDEADAVAGWLRMVKSQRDELNTRALGLAVQWSGDPEHARLFVAAQALSEAMAGGDQDSPAVVLLDADLGASLGEVLLEEVGVTRPLFCLDGISVEGCDFVDVGELLRPSLVLPVTVKSLVFAAACPEEPEP